jgi:hypothetical protein
VHKIRQLRELVRPEMVFRLIVYYIRQEMKSIKQQLTNDMINLKILEKVMPERRHSAAMGS